MTILAIDGGLETFGWAVVRERTGAVLALGELHQRPDNRKGVHAERLRRGETQARLLHGLVGAYDVGRIVAEEPSFAKPTPACVASCMLPWGAILGVAACHGLASPDRIPPKTWQRAVLGLEEGDYAVIEAKLAAYLVGKPLEQLLAIPRGRRSHPLDAVGIGVYAALRLVQREGAAA